jgi:hypothetical protein
MAVITRLLDRIANQCEPVFGVPRICADCTGIIFEGAIPHTEDGVTTFYHPHRCEKRLPYRPMRGVPFPWTAEQLESFRVNPGAPGQKGDADD